MRDIGRKFSNNVEISAQEAAYLVLQLPIRKASRQAIFINTSPPEERVELLKPINDITDMEDDCEEIYTSGLLLMRTKRMSCKMPSVSSFLVSHLCMQIHAWINLARY